MNCKRLEGEEEPDGGFTTCGYCWSAYCLSAASTLLWCTLFGISGVSECYLKVLVATNSYYFHFIDILIDILFNIEARFQVCP